MKHRLSHVWLLLLPVAVIVSFHRLTFSNRILARGDIYLYFYPYWEAAAAALRDGRLPLWNPYLFMGAPLLANSQVGFFYPLNWPLWLLLPVPYAATATIVVHAIVAATGAYVLARRSLNLQGDAALLVGMLFGLGGYLTAQVEHLNQLQVISWLPWALIVSGAPGDWTTKQAFARRLALLSALFALQLTAGHSQSVFISGVALFLWWLGGTLAQRNNWHQPARALLGLASAGGLALALCAVQLLPTLELATLSSRQSGLRLHEALSFSLHPLILGRSLLPGYGETLFTEFVAFLPLTALMLATVGISRLRQEPKLWSPALLVAVGLSFALGQFNPLYIGFATLPGFSLFRVPARWLALYSLGAALLAGVGWQQWRAAQLPLTRQLRAAFAITASLVGWSLIAPFLAGFIPVAAEAPAQLPLWSTLAGWMVELAAAGLILLRTTGASRLPRAVTLLLIAAVLYLSGRALPHHQMATAPQAYFSTRAPAARLLTSASCSVRAVCPGPGGRVLSLSNILFDLGDSKEIEAAYRDYLNDQAFFQLIVAHKQKEVLDPNLPLANGIQSVDGFDGGILPLQSYVELTSLLLPGGAHTTDGRLREFLETVPDDRWLDLLQVQYLITDKTADVWSKGVFFDSQHRLELADGDEQAVGYLPPYEATAVWLLASGPGEIVVIAGDEVWTLQVEQIEDDLWGARLPAPVTPEALLLRAGSGPWTVRGLALIDQRDDTFQPLVPGDFRLIHSGDVKIYDNLDVMRRAFLVYRWQWHEDVAASVAAMANPTFSPREEAVLVGSGAPPSGEQTTGEAQITAYAEREIAVDVATEQPGLLILTDAAYPGWTATVGGEPAPIYQADGLFRGVMIPAGEHRVIFRFAPTSLRWGAGISLAGVVVWLAIITAGMVRHVRQEETRKL